MLKTSLMMNTRCPSLGVALLCLPLSPVRTSLRVSAGHEISVCVYVGMRRAQRKSTAKKHDTKIGPLKPVGVDFYGFLTSFIILMDL